MSQNSINVTRREGGSTEPVPNPFSQDSLEELVEKARQIFDLNAGFFVLVPLDDDKKPTGPMNIYSTGLTAIDLFSLFDYVGTQLLDSEPLQKLFREETDEEQDIDVDEG